MTETGCKRLNIGDDGEKLMNSVCILALKSEHKNLEYCSVFCEIPVSGLNNVKEEAVL